MFCIFPAISAPRDFKLEATEKALRHFSFSDVFSEFLKSRGMSPLPKTPTKLPFKSTSEFVPDNYAILLSLKEKLDSNPKLKEQDANICLNMKKEVL